MCFNLCSCAAARVAQTTDPAPPTLMLRSFLGPVRGLGLYALLRANRVSDAIGSIMVGVDRDPSRGLVLRQALIQFTQLLANLRLIGLAEVVDKLFERLFQLR